MSLPGSLGNVIDFPPRHAHKQDTCAKTVILRASSVRQDAETYRHIGINGALHLGDLHRVLCVCFGIDPTAGAVHWHFTAGGHTVDGGETIGDYLSQPGDHLTYHWGLWPIHVMAVESHPRDAATPAALCVGGSGAFGRIKFDLPRINAELTGTDTIRDVLARTHPAARSIIQRSGLTDFVPLLQAMDLGAPTQVCATTRSALSDLPHEVDLAGRDAFWCVVLALACLAEDTVATDIALTTMEALGWVADDGQALDAQAMFRLCGSSLKVLRELGAIGPHKLPAIERHDLYRELLTP